jgi:aspartate aminotransferase
MMVTTFKQRHDFVLKSLLEIQGVDCLPSQGTFFIFPNMQGVMNRLGIKTDLELAEKLMATGGVAVVPGSAFGAAGYIRISFATSMEDLKKAMERMAKALN